ncbi:MAG: sulfite exporter TauE/SafE family protein [Gammaproteobacteria bacterium]|nr:sulfite exporter TauE/SafE family protein [Gammaproteobacteria bacterium]
MDSTPLAQLIGYTPVIVAMVLSGVVGGLMAGLLGVGGGIVIVPVLDFAYALLGVDPAVRLQFAVATSLATIIPTSISSARSHHSNGAVDMALFHRWRTTTLVASAFGAVLASMVSSHFLALVFGSVALLVAAKMLLLREDLRLLDAVPRGPLSHLIPFGIGSVSSMMGIGGGTLGVPTLTLLNHPVHAAVGTSAALGLVISIPATLAYIITGWNDGAALPGSIGYVNVPGFLLIAPLTTYFAPYGARLAHRLSRQRLSRVFGVFLLIVGGRMLYNALV